MNKIKVAQFGLGPIGIETIKLAAAKPWVQFVGGVDIDPGKQGHTLAQLTGVAALRSCKVYPTFEALWDDALRSQAAPEIVLHTAGSKADQAIEQIRPMAARGVHVVSSCEELLYPWLRAREAADSLDQLCREKGARVVGTGVNPGFVMDVLPVFMTGVSRSVESIYGERVVNASTRRMPLQKKIGSGLDPEHFKALFEQGRAGHAGFKESLSLIAHALGWTLDKINETCEPVIADHEIQTDYFRVAKGLTCGLHQRTEGVAAGKARIVLDLKMYLDAKDPHDLVKVEGDPALEVLVKNGVAGDSATVAALVNTAARIAKASPGLLLMTDLPVPCWR